MRKDQCKEDKFIVEEGRKWRSRRKEVAEGREGERKETVLKLDESSIAISEIQTDLDGIKMNKNSVH